MTVDSGAPDRASQISLATADDVRAIEMVVTAAYDRYLPRMDLTPAPLSSDYGAAVQAGSVWVVGKPMAGVICLTESEGSLLIENVAVHPSAQGSGLGRRLMAFAEEEAARRRLKRLTLYTNEVMVESLAIYTHLGYVERERRTEDGYHRVFMEKLL